MATLPGTVDISEEFLVTDEEKDYFRWRYKFTQNGMQFIQTLCVFESGDLKLAINFTRPANQGEEYDELVDASMRSVRFEE